jgi:ACS family hexuronate transporter-like MFS transporter
MLNGKYRWMICALIFFATTINYIDRQILSLVKEYLDVQFGWSKADFGLVNSMFQAAYGVGLLFFGWFVDRFGVKTGYAVSMIGWSLAAMAHAFVAMVPGNATVELGGTVFGGAAIAVGSFGLCRVLLGLAEAGNFPAAIKGVAQWFPKNERAFATSLFNSGANVGALLAPALVSLLAIHYGWSMPFSAAGVAGFVWLGFWLYMYDVPEKHAGVTKEEMDYILSDREAAGTTEKVRWFKLFGYKQTWSFVIAKFLTDPVWWFFLIWLPDYFKTTLLLDIKKSWPLLVTIYGIITVLSIVGGWMSGHLAKKGWSITRARKTCMIVFACCVIPVMFTTQFGRFNVDQRFFEKLKTATYTVETIVTVDGQKKKEKVQHPVPAEVGTALQLLAGKTFRSIEEFLKAAGQNLYPEQTKAMQAALAGKTCATLDDYIQAVGGTMAPDLASKVKKNFEAKKAPCKSTEAFISAVNEVEAARIQQPLADCARDNKLFWIAVLLIGLAGAAHQAWSANLFTTASDMFPKKAVASVIGLGGMAGSFGGMMFPVLTGKLLDHFKAGGSETAGYALLFTFCAFAYLVAFAINHLLAPRYEQVDWKD